MRTNHVSSKVEIFGNFSKWASSPRAYVSKACNLQHLVRGRDSRGIVETVPEARLIADRTG